MTAAMGRRQYNINNFKDETYKKRIFGMVVCMVDIPSSIENLNMKHQTMYVLKLRHGIYLLINLLFG